MRIPLKNSVFYFTIFLVRKYFKYLKTKLNNELKIELSRRALSVVYVLVGQRSNAMKNHNCKNK